MYEFLRKIRKDQGLSGKDMCSLLGLKSKASYYKKEDGSVKFSLGEAKVIAELFGKSIEDIFFDENVSNFETDDQQAF